jgi:Tfp pilus assembly protein PilF
MSKVSRTARLIGCALAACLAISATARRAGSQAPDAPEAERELARGLTALHNFEYEEANDAFRRARAADPRLALAYWGEAMTYDQLLWRHENVAAARDVLNRFAPTPRARASKARNAKERGLLAAADLLFGDGDAPARHRRHAAAMAALYADDPDDPDIASLYALCLISGVSRGLIGAGTHGGSDAHTDGLAGSETQRQAAAILQRVLASHPQHPGALHYLLHDYDDPRHAPLALDAARAYARVAGGASHALHMPSHIFLQLGLWHDAAASDRASYEASADWVRQRHLGPAMKNFHALSWLQYELLQLGRYREASQLVLDVESALAGIAGESPAPAGSHQPLLADRSSMRARFVVETRRWETMAGERNFGNADELFAIGASAARAGALDLAERARQALADRAQAAQEGELRPAIAIMEREVAAIVALARGRRDEALAILRAAADSEDALPAPFGLPQPIKPAPELLGETLLEAGRPAEAVAAFDRALTRNANRSASVLGRARAALASGDTAGAHTYYARLLANFDRADAGVTDVAEARAALGRTAVGERSRGRSALTWAALGLAALIALAWVAVRRRKGTEGTEGTEGPERTGSHRGTKKRRRAG